MTSQIERDLTLQFSDKLRRLICDTVDTFERVNMSEEAAASVILVLGKHLAMMMLCCGGNEDAFVAVIRQAFSIVKEQERKAGREHNATRDS